tara:strand:- start:66192 stop:66776 length:585 start_codon:yes stop_codon:yes gene_type:complete
MKLTALRKFSLCLIPSLFLFFSCGEEEYSPKPRGYFRIDLPTKEYQDFNQALPYDFKVNKNAIWDPAKRVKNWGDIYYPRLKARIKLSYRSVSEENLDVLLNDAMQMAYEHTRKADGIEDIMVSIPENNVHGMIFKIAGDAATNTQFFVTDSTDHFLRGVIYFYASPNADSLRPLNEFMMGETKQLIESLKWQN